MKKIYVEFFHDVLCAYCFPMSYHMRQIAQEIEGIEIVHRSYALIPNAEAYVRYYGSNEKAKALIVRGWDKANALHPLRPMNKEKMQKADFPYPTSMESIYALAAAHKLGGETLYWDLFDALQNAFFTQAGNIGDREEILRIAGEAGIDALQLRRALSDTAYIQEKMENDFALADRYQVNVVPTLIVNGEHRLSGALSYGQVKEFLQKF